MRETLKPLLKWFGYTRRERRSSFILVIILVLIITLRYTVPERSTDFEILPDSSYRYPVGEDESIYPDDEISSAGSGSLLRSYSAASTWQESEKRGVQRIDLNSCDSADLERLPMLGPVLSSRIIKYRNILGGFVSVIQLREVYGISDSAMMVLSGRLRADTSGISRIDVNSAGFGDLLRHPYIERSEVRSILNYRELNGYVRSLDELVENRVLTQTKADRLRPYLSFDR
jgi:DNA uptake protein ComE-like DNA-binding protein